MQHKILILMTTLVRSGIRGASKKRSLTVVWEASTVDEAISITVRNRQRLQSLISDCKTNLDCNMLNTYREEKDIPRRSHLLFVPQSILAALTPAQLMHSRKISRALSHLLQRSTLPRKAFRHLPSPLS